MSRYENLVYSAALQTGLPRDAAVDVFQQVWLELHRSLLRIRDAQALPRWLTVTTRRIAYRHAVVTGRWVDTVREDVVDPDPGPDSVVIAMEERQFLERGIEQLGKRCRDLIRLLFFGARKVSYAEAARRMGVSEDSVGSMRKRCLDRLRLILEGEE